MLEDYWGIMVLGKVMENPTKKTYPWFFHSALNEVILFDQGTLPKELVKPYVAF